MKKAYDKKQIMKKAWELYKGSKKLVACYRKSFGDYLRMAWAEAKQRAESIAKVVDGVGKNVKGCLVFVRKAMLAESGRPGWYLDGRTYPIRREIKAAGFYFDGEAKKWATEDIETVADFIA